MVNRLNAGGICVPKFNKWLNMLLDGYGEMLIEKNPSNNKEYYQFLVAWIKKYEFLMKKELDVICAKKESIVYLIEKGNLLRF